MGQTRASQAALKRCIVTGKSRTKSLDGKAMLWRNLPCAACKKMLSLDLCCVVIHRRTISVIVLAVYRTAASNAAKIGFKTACFVLSDV